MSWTRRGFLSASVGTLAGWTAASAAARVGASGVAASGDDPVLVLVQLTGGNDGLNTLVPYRHPVYRSVRPKLGITEQDVLKLDDEVGLHPSLRPWMDLWDDDSLAVVQGVGTTLADRSHFRSMRTWHTGLLDGDPATRGWVTAALEQLPQERRGSVPAVQIASTPLTQALVGGSTQAPTLERPEDLQLLSALDQSVSQRQISQLERLTGRVASDSPLLRSARAGLESACVSSSRLSQALSSPSQLDYPTFYPLGGRLQLIAQCIRAGFGAQVYFTELGGFDTHANQRRSHTGLLTHLGNSLSTFQRDLAEGGVDKSVLTLVYSEFGRRVAENASGGTDHGTAAPMFAIGPSVRGGIVGDAPDLTELVDGDPVSTTDFRSVYETVLDRWFGVDSRPVLGSDFGVLDFV